MGKILNWFSMNYLKANPGMSQLLLTLKEEARIKLVLQNSFSKRLLRALLDNKLTFSHYVSKLC